jgi:RNA polymerase sigma-70 factor, ECF subfamily
VTIASSWNPQWPPIIAVVPVEQSAGMTASRAPTRVERSARGLVGNAALGSAASIDVPDDLDVVRAVLAGDREAFRVLVDRESTAIVRACYRVLGDVHEAEDAAQETFVTAYRSLATWRGEGPFGAWLTRIAVRLAVRQAGRRKAVPWAGSVAPSGTDESAAVPASTRMQPEQVALRAERASATRRALAGLDEPYREVVALRFFGERSLEEIATLTDRPLGTVKTHLRRGLIRLRESLEPGGGW